jgi:hypothetical protein
MGTSVLNSNPAARPGGLTAEDLYAEPEAVSLSNGPLWVNEWADSGIEWGESALLVLMLLIGLIPVMFATSGGAKFGTEPTLGLLLAIFAAYQLAANRCKPAGILWSSNSKHTPDSQ